MIGDHVLERLCAQLARTRIWLADLLALRTSRVTPPSTTDQGEPRA